MERFMSLLETLAPLLLAGVACLTTAVWFAVRRNGAMSEARRLRYCPRCGLDIAARMSVRGAIPHARPVSAGMAAPRAAASGVMPSELLRGGWSRSVQPAADAAGRAVFSDSPDARFFTLCGAMNRAFDPGSRQWEQFLRQLQTVLKERFGKVSIQKWNRSQTQNTVVSVAEEAERKMRQDGG